MLSNKVCIVTGASRGIGKSVANKFAQSGAQVIATALHTKMEWVSEWNSKFPNKIKDYTVDITNSDAIREMIANIRKEYGRIDVLVNNAGIVTYEMLSMVSKQTMREMFEVNVFALIELMQYVSRVMCRQRSGSIINISSIVGEKGVSGQLAYSASKGAVIAATKSAAKELASYGIRVNAIAPGMIATERLSAVAESKFPERIRQIGMGHMGTPDDVANACLFFASDMSQYVTGQILGVEGSFAL